MNLLKISWSNIRFRPLNTLLSVVLLAFGVGIISLMLLIKDQISEKFDRNIKDIDFVLAAKGSPLQSILANVYHVDAPTGNIKVADAKRLIRNPMVQKAIPLAYGDNYEKYRIVGTNKDYPDHYGCKITAGVMFEKPFEATIGAEVAKEANLKVGSTFTSVHGFDNAAEGDPDAHHHDKPFTVVGIFETSGCVIDHLILTPVESTWLVHEHGHEEHADEDHDHLEEDAHVSQAEAPAEEGHEHHDEVEVVRTEVDTSAHGHSLIGGAGMERPDAGMQPSDDHQDDPEREMTAYLLIKRNKGAFGMLSKQCENTTMQLANVAVENSRLMNNFGIGLSTITAIAIVITILSFISIFISLYNSMKERKYELALLRTMGGTRKTLFSLILSEGIILVLMGYVIGIVLSRTGLLILGQTMKDNFHYGFDKLGITMWEVLLLAITLLIGIVASLLPAMRALKIDISKTLSNG